MGHRVYLMARTEAEDKELFEANNFLPFFWLTLLDQPALAGCEKWWLEAERLTREDELDYERFSDVWPPLTALSLNPADLHRNTARTRLFLARHFPGLSAAYQEFANCLLAQLPSEDDTVMLDIYALAAFTSALDYHRELAAQVAALDEQQPWRWGEPGPTLPELTGFASEAAFTEGYPALRQLRQPSQLERPLPPATRPAPRAASLKAISPPAAREKIDLAFGLLTLGLLAAISVATHKIFWQQRAYGFPLPFYKLPAAGPPEWHLGALSLDVPLTAFLAWHLRGLALAIKELVDHWRRR